MDRQDIHDALNLETRALLDEIHVFDAIDSTNLEALRQHRAGRRGTFLLLANKQTAGRGRRGRTWLSPSGGLYLSLIRSFEAEPSSMQALSLVTALAVHSACRRLGAENLQLKWPNDVLAGNKKLAGVLLEWRNVESSQAIVFGIGLNLSLSAGALAAIDRPVTDLQTVIGTNPGQTRVAAAVTEELLASIVRFEQSGFSVFQEAWNENDRYREQDIVIQSGNTRIIGKSQGVDPHGSLMLQSMAGLELISSGEIFGTLNLFNNDRHAIFLRWHAVLAITCLSKGVNLCGLW